MGMNFVVISGFKLVLWTFIFPGLNDFAAHTTLMTLFEYILNFL